MITYPGMWYGSGVIKVDFLPMLCALLSLLSRLKYCYHGNSFAHRVAKQPLPDRRPSTSDRRDVRGSGGALQ